MKRSVKLWRNKKWFDFSDRVKGRDGYRCLLCGRGEPEVVLQVHHEIYVQDKLPWEYSLSDCRTLCRGCHAREHHLIEPGSGWTLLMIQDLGDASGVCERTNCGSPIRYQHLTYHPGWGYKIVGSTCIEYLTQKDRALSDHVIKSYKNISEFVHASVWQTGFTQKGKKFISAKYKHHMIRIYGEDARYSFQLAIKEKGRRWYNYQDVINAANKSLDEVKELSFIVLKGTISSDEKEKSLLRDLYRRVR